MGQVLPVGAVFYPRPPTKIPAQDIIDPGVAVIFPQNPHSSRQ